MVQATIQRYLPQHIVSKTINLLSHCRLPWFKNWAIRRFIRKYNVQLHEALSEKLADYPSLNAFFIRQLKSHLRPMNPADNVLISPADSTIQQLGTCLDDGQVLAIKGKSYSLQQLLANDAALYQTFHRAHCITQYLAAGDYHRVHMPLTGRLQKIWKIPGRLFSVNPNIIARIPSVFAQNERVLMLFETQFGPMLVIMVGAMLVSGITLSFLGETSPQPDKTNQTIDYQYQHPPIIVKKGQELGYFEFGSTVLVLLARETDLHWQNALTLGTKLQWGQTLGEIK